MDLPTVLSALGLLLSLGTLGAVWALQRRLDRLPRDLEEGHSRTRSEVKADVAMLQHTLGADLRRIESGLAEGREQQLRVLGDYLHRCFEALQGSLQEALRQGRHEQAQRLQEVQAQVVQVLKDLQADNAQKLEAMRATVDEKLHETLERRLGESFQQVAHRLEQVQKGLGEMQSLAQDVGGLKRALVNVKTRGVLGEAQLGSLLEQFLAPGQFATQVRLRPRSQEAVDFAVRLPGAEEGEGVWLPLDAKFPLEDYQRLMEASELGDRSGAEAAAKALEARLVGQARDIRDKYILPPATTDFALMFLPFEGLYAEALRRPGLLERLQREFRVTLVGPTTLTAFLNSLQVGFKTLAITRRSSEVWKVLGAVKAEFGRFGEALSAVQKRLDDASSKLGDVAKRREMMERRLSKVEALPETLPEVPALGSFEG